MDDRKILALFHARSEQAIDSLAAKYGKLCQHIAHRILDSSHDAEECVNDAYLALWNTIPPENPKSLRAYLTRVVRNIAYDRRDYQTAQMRDSRVTVCLAELQDCLPDSMTIDAALDAALIRDTLNAFLRALSKEDRFIFLRRYYFLDTCRQISKYTGMAESAVSTRLGRLRGRLKELLKEEGIYV